EEIRKRSFPAVMDPEPVFRRAPHLSLDDFVDTSGERFNRVRLAIDWRLDRRAPARKSASVHSHRSNLGICPSGQQSGQWRGRGNAAEKWRPHASVASMLVAQNSDPAAIPQQLDGFAKTLTAFKNFQAKTSPGGTYVPINKTIF